MQAVVRLATQVQRRLRLQRWLRVVAPALVLACGAAIVSIIAARVNGHSGLSTAVGVAVVTFGCTVRVLLRRHSSVSLLSAAIQLDERLQLDGRMATSLTLQRRTDAFSVAAVQDGQRVAGERGRSDMARQVFPIVWPSSTPWIPAAIVAVLLAAWLLPVRPATETTPTGVPAADPSKQQSHAEQLNAGIAKAIQTLEADPQTKENLEALLASIHAEELKAQQSEGDPATREAQASQRAAALEERLEQEMNSPDALQSKAFRDLLATMPELDDRATELSQALKTGEIEAAMDQLKKLAEAANSSDPTTSAAAMRAMEKLAHAIEQIGQSNAASRDALSKAGMDPSLASNPAEAAKAIDKNTSLSPQQKEALKNQMQANAKASEQCRSVANDLRTAKPGSMSSAQKNLSRAAAQQRMQRTLSSAMSECKNASSMGWSMPWQKKSVARGAGTSGAGGTQGGQGGAPKTDGQTKEIADGTVPESQESAGDGDPLDQIVARDFVRGQGATATASTQQLQAVAAKVEAGLEEGSEEDPVPTRYQAAHKRYFEQWKRTLTTPSAAGARP